ncbi:UNVERIFIED_ORG: hypothetical protein J2W82_002262 [Pseudomonas mohnii]|jgi:hypothetical protein|nr:hypothetical protein [Pseudomonas mohnii]
MLAMEVNDDAGSLTPRSALRFFASVLAPTGLYPVLKYIPKDTFTRTVASLAIPAYGPDTTISRPVR